MMTKIEKFAKLMEIKNNTRLSVHSYRYEMVVEVGRKYAKIVRTERNTDTGMLNEYSRSVAAFVDMKTGDIYKPANWKSPAKGIRGNVNINDGADSLDHHGFVRYARGGM